MAQIIAITNQKGGVGKTTTAVNLAASLAEAGRRVLLVDIDPQGNATTGSGVDKATLEQTVCEVLLGQTRTVDAIIKVEKGNYDLLPANPDLTAAEVQLLQVIGREMKLRQALETVSGMYDYVFIDCPPSINMLTLNALTACHGVLIPIQCEYYALEGLSSLLETIRQIRDSVNPKIRIQGLLRTMYDPRNRLSDEVSAQLLKHFDDKVYKTVIPRNVRLAEAPSFGVPIMFHDARSAGAESYRALAKEMLDVDAPAKAGAA